METSFRNRVIWWDPTSGRAELEADTKQWCFATWDRRRATPVVILVAKLPESGERLVQVSHDARELPVWEPSRLVIRCRFSGTRDEESPERVDVYWNVDSNRFLERIDKIHSTEFTLLKEKPPMGYMWSGVDLTTVQPSTRPDHEWHEVWTKIRKASQKREKQEWKTRSQNSTMLDDWEESTLLIRMAKKKTQGNP